MTNPDDDLRDLRTAWQAAMPAATRVTRERLERKAARSARGLRFGTAAMVALCLVEVVAFGMFAVRTNDPGRRAGAIMTSAGILYLAYEIWKNLMVVRELEARLAGAPSLVFYRAFFVQMRDWSRGRWFWRRWAAVAPGPLLYSWAGVRHGEPPGIFYTFVALLLLAIVLNVFVGAPAMQRRVDALDRVADGD